MKLTSIVPEPLVDERVITLASFTTTPFIYTSETSSAIKNWKGDQ